MACRVLLIAIWYGMIGGFLEGLVRVLLGSYWNPFRGGTDVTQQFIWIASLSNVALFLLSLAG